MKYKKGDKLKCVLDGSYKQLTVGKIYIQTQDSDHTYISDDFGEDSKWYADMFQLVPEESELERLVRIANEGRTALNVLCKDYPDQTEFAYDGDCWHKVNSITYFQCEIRVKPKAVFEPFHVQNDTGCTGWPVRIENGFVHVGCHKFELIPLSNALENLTKGSSASCSVGEHRLHSMRNGICCDGRYTVRWEDCDLLCKKLEE